ncbi:MAG: methyl-accepting chemotaxis protein [Gammaproteobacteria bacterium]|nr:methyl-accepting chemotaxis protein [Gammaproteobacteria bacterium]
MGSQLAERLQGKTVRGKIYRMLGTLFAIMLVSTAGYLAYSQSVLVEGLVERQTRDLANSYFDNINTLMLTGGMANREIPRTKLMARPEVVDARILRGPSITKLFGPGSEHARAVDELDRRALAGETVSEIRDGEQGRTLTVLVPLPASADFRGTNCIACHVSQQGEILGAVRVDYSLQALDATVARDLFANIGINSALMVVGLLVIGALFSRIVSNPLKQLNTAMHAVAEGRADWSQRLHVKSNDEIGDLARHFNTAIERFGTIIDDTRRSSEAATRLKTALDCVSTNVMVADRDNRIIYTNQAVQAMFSAAEHDLRERLPQFDAGDLIDRSIDDLYADSAQQRHVLESLDQRHESQIVIGERTFRTIANPVVDDDGRRLGTAVEWADLTDELKAADETARRLDDERRIAMENLQIRTALDNVSSSVMVADKDFNIIYVNKALATMFGAVESDLRQVLPGFSANGILGCNMDGFHKQPGHQRRMLERMRTSVSSEIEVAGLTMRVIANPVLDGAGNRLGTVVEWADRTEEVAVEREIAEMVVAARSGDLARRIRLDDKEGFLQTLAAGINDLVGDLASVFDDIADAMKHVAEGDLTRPIERDYAGVFGRVKSDVNATIGNVEKTIRELRTASDAITTGATEISAGNNNLSSRTEQQASALEQTAASMEQLTSTVRNNADNAQQANQVASSASQLAARGGDVVGRAVTAMDEISASSNRIAEIIGVIDDIAFQTNLLALNASVEAARAGEQGRGFAVVATEVRNLAGRSATAAREIKELIQDSVAKVRSGTELVNESGQTLDDIVVGVKKVSDIIAEIAAASAEQSAGIDQVNLAVTSMDEVTQQNAALAEQASAASVSMSDKADEMMRLVSFFKVKATAAAAAAAPVPATPPPVSADRTAASRVRADVPAPVKRPAPPPSKGAAQPPAVKPAVEVEARPLRTSAAASDFADDDDEWEEF